MDVYINNVGAGPVFVFRNEKLNGGKRPTVISCLIIVAAMRGFPSTQRTDRRWIPKTVNQVPWSISANNMKPLRPT
jgi:hypothetical protein